MDDGNGPLIPESSGFSFCRLENWVGIRQCGHWPRTLSCSLPHLAQIMVPKFYSDTAYNGEIIVVMSIRYKDHLIDPRVYELRGRNGFSAEVYVFDIRESTDTLFLLKPSVFQTRDTALQAAVQAGRQAVDQGYDPSVNLFTQ